jgi:hypothetical protein
MPCPEGRVQDTVQNDEWDADDQPVEEHRAHALPPPGERRPERGERG